MEWPDQKCRKFEVFFLYKKFFFIDTCKLNAVLYMNLCAHKYYILHGTKYCIYLLFIFGFFLTFFSCSMAWIPMQQFLQCIQHTLINVQLDKTIVQQFVGQGIRSFWGCRNGFCKNRSLAQTIPLILIYFVACCDLLQNGQIVTNAFFPHWHVCGIESIALKGRIVHQQTGLVHCI